MAVKTLVINFDEDGKFLSATKQEHNKDDGEGNSVPQPNKSIDETEARNLLA